MRSDEQFLGVERSLQRAWAKGAGLIDEEFERPMIAVVNTYQEFSPENIHLRQVGEAVKSGVRMAGGTPCEFNTFHVTDSETFASVGMRYVLPSRRAPSTSSRAASPPEARWSRRPASAGRCGTRYGAAGAGVRRRRERHRCGTRHATSPRRVKDLIEEALFARRRDLFTALDLVFFDTTSLFFTQFSRAPAS